MNQNIRSAFPRAILLGTDDASIATIPFEEIQDSQHIPLLLLRTQKGPEEVTIIPTSMFTGVYGEESTETNGLYHTHQTEALKAAARAGNATIAVKRILGEKPVKSKMVLYTKVTETQNQVNYQVTNKNTPVDNTSYYELISVENNTYGQHGDYYGFSFLPADDKTQMLYGSAYNGFIYELRFFRRDALTNQRTLMYTNDTDEKALFTLNPNTLTMQDNPYYITNVINEMYNSTDTTLLNRIGNIVINQDALSALHTGLTKNGLTDKTHYWDYDILSTAKFTMAKELIYNFTGGDDGYKTVNANFVTMKINLLEEYDNLVYNYLGGIEDGHELSNMAKYPFSIIYDTGFSMQTKLRLRVFLALRLDVMIGLTTFMVANHYEDVDGSMGFSYQYTDDQVNSIAMASALKAAFTLYPESTVYGTPTMRVFITIQSGILPKSAYTYRQSINIDLVEKLSRYMGNGIGWVTSQAFDKNPMNELSDWINVNFTYRSNAMKETAWDAGIIWIENKDTTTMFYPAFQTVYPDDTSVLNNIFTVMACCYLTKLSHKVWARTTGNAKDSNEMLAERISVEIDNATIGIFDNRFVITSSTYFTPADVARGYSWSTEIQLYSPVAKTVGTYKIKAYRKS